MSGLVRQTERLGVDACELEEALHEAVARATREQETCWLAIRIEVAPEFDLVDVFCARDERDRFLWSIPGSGVEILGCGATYRLEPAGADRLAQADAAVRAAASRIEVCGRAGPREAGPIFAAGFAFAEAPQRNAWLPGARAWARFGNARLFVPRLSWTRTRACPDVVRGCATLEVAPSARVAQLKRSAAEALEALEAPLRDPVRSSSPAAAPAAEFRTRADRSHPQWCQGVEVALGAIATGELEKVVLARSMTLESAEELPLRELLHTMRERHPDSATFAFARESDCFLGATPERLVALDGDLVRTAAVAGSAPRGRSPEEDAARGEALQQDPKEQAEHAIVVREIRRSLEGPCGALDGPDEPRLLQLDAIQHLETPLEGKLVPGVASKDITLLQLAARLHPTPAVGGAPRRAALSWLAANEELERGWYAGPIGWLGLDGGGELRVALRSALLELDRRRARLYAGAGIVSGSEPARELCETRLKLRTLLAPLMEV